MKKGFFKWLSGRSPDILCIQEVKANPDQVSLNPFGYFTYWHPAKKKGYSGVVTFTKNKPLRVEKELGIEVADNEGRFLLTEFEKFYLINLYFPNAQRGLARLDFRLEFNQALLEYIEKLRKESSKGIILCGDFNAAHAEIDLKNPKQNQNNAGFSPKERAYITELIDNGYLDTFREFDKSPGNYTWWTYRYNARTKNIGWRIDYFFVNQEFRNKLKSAFILKDVQGSDHCPIGITLALE